MTRAKMITADEKKLLDFISDYVDKYWDFLTEWEQNFVENILSLYDMYQDRMYLSKKQVSQLLKIAEKIG